MNLLEFQDERETIRVADTRKLVEVNFGKYELLSFGIFATLSVVALIFEKDFFEFYALLLITDGVATLLDSSLIVSVDRTLFLFMFIVLGSLSGDFGSLDLVVVTLTFLTLVDLSFLLRRIEDTKVVGDVFQKRLAAYCYTIIPAFLLTYIVVFLYLQITISSSEAILVLGMSVVGGFIIVYLLARSFARPQSVLGKKDGKS
ncbi:MAG: hypothetical protein ACYCQJ_00795 [Nitrososphaerales archaeon]